MNRLLPLFSLLALGLLLLPPTSLSLEWVGMELWVQLERPATLLPGVPLVVAAWWGGRRLLQAGGGKGQMGLYLLLLAGLMGLLMLRDPFGFLTAASLVTLVSYLFLSAPRDAPTGPRLGLFVPMFLGDLLMLEGFLMQQSQQMGDALLYFWLGGVMKAAALGLASQFERATAGVGAVKRQVVDSVVLPGVLLGLALHSLPLLDSVAEEGLPPLLVLVAVMLLSGLLLLLMVQPTRERERLFPLSFSLLIVLLPPIGFGRLSPEVVTHLSLFLITWLVVVGMLLHEWRRGPTLRRWEGYLFVAVAVLLPLSITLSALGGATPTRIGLVAFGAMLAAILWPALPAAVERAGISSSREYVLLAVLLALTLAGEAARRYLALPLLPEALGLSLLSAITGGMLAWLPSARTLRSRLINLPRYHLPLPQPHAGGGEERPQPPLTTPLGTRLDALIQTLERRLTHWPLAVLLLLSLLLTLVMLTLRLSV